MYSQHTAAHCNTLQHTATHCNTLQHSATLCSTLQHTAAHSNTLQHTASCCNTRNTLQHTASCCNTLQHTATHCITLQHTQHTACIYGTLYSLKIFLTVSTDVFVRRTASKISQKSELTCKMTTELTFENFNDPGLRRRLMAERHSQKPVLSVS